MADNESAEVAEEEDGDALAAEWAAMADDDEDGEGDKFEAAGGSGGSTRILNQDEIDSLLGFDGAE